MRARDIGKVLLIALLAILPPLTRAQPGPTSVFLFGFKAESRTDRVVSARAMLAHVEFVASTVPTIRPSDKEWVASERAAIGRVKEAALSNERMKQLLASAEYQHIELDYVLTNIRDALKCVVQQDVLRQREIHCWAVAAYHFNYADFTYAIATLRKAGRMTRVNLVAMDGDKAIDDDGGLALLYRAGARQIQEAAVLPYLRGDLK